MKARPARPGITATKKLYEELDQLRQSQRDSESTTEFLSIAYRQEYKLNEQETLPPVPIMTRKLIVDFRYKIATLEKFHEDIRHNLVKTAWATALFLAVAVWEGIFIWFRILGGVK